MRKRELIQRSLAVLLAFSMLFSMPVAVAATDGSSSESLSFSRAEYTPDAHLADSAVTNENAQDMDSAPYGEHENVRVSIVLEDASTIATGYSMAAVATDNHAEDYRAYLLMEQEFVTDEIETQILDGEELDVVWNLTLAANIISANVEYGQIEAIKDTPGVADVFVETQYAPAVLDVDLPADPNMATSSAQIGSSIAWGAGYTGAGRRIAIIDTGIDTDHQSFAEGGYEYSLSVQTEKAGYTDVEAYKADLNLLDVDEVAALLAAGKLNVSQFSSRITAEELHLSNKIPFAYNYVDHSLTVDHDHDSQGEHGSHVAGISAANAYIADSSKETGYSPALEAVHTQGVAPDAQIIAMKVFGSNGGAYDSDYFAAVEDALALGCDVVNLSLGSPTSGWSYYSAYNDILDSLVNSGMVMVTSAGNSGSWADNTHPGSGYLYGDDVSLHTGGSPGTLTNTLNVASVDNRGATDTFLTAYDTPIFYTGTNDENNPSITTIAGEHPYIFVDSYGDSGSLDSLDVANKIVFVWRGDGVNFSTKANTAYAAGASAVVIVNNADGTINMGLSGYTGNIPVVSISLADGVQLWKNAGGGEISGPTGDGKYVEGTIVVGDTVDSVDFGKDRYTMSSFSSWGIPQSLELKPEITAPGGNIYSVNGIVPGGAAYENMSGTSMAAPQVSGMTALVSQFIEDKGYDVQARRTLATSLLMSTADPLLDADGNYYSVLNQGSGLANIGSAVNAQSYIMMNEDATNSYADGKIKAELGDDPSKTGVYNYSFTINNLNGQENSYTLSTDLFTQDLFEDSGYTWLDTQTVPVLAEMAYSINGRTFVPRAGRSADVNRDGITDVKDAQALLDYITGKNSGGNLNLSAGDLDGDGKYTTYDAHLILANMKTEAFAVPANGSVTVSVSIRITGDLSAYEKGAYVEGYTFVNPVASAEGALDVTHSIPILGFYGNWSEPSMFDHGTYVDYLYGDESIPYAAPSYLRNYLTYTDSARGGSYVQIGNPYGIEETYPEGKAAIRSTDKLHQLGFTLIRNATAMGDIITDEDGNILHASSPTSYGNYNYSAYYSASSSAWGNASIVMTMNQQVSSLGVREGDTIHVSFIAIPEYYLKEANAATENEEAFNITRDEFISIVESGELGEGCFLTTTLKVDDTAPVLRDVQKNPKTGDLTVTASDNEAIAYIGVLTRSGTREYASILAPEANADGTVTYTFAVGDAGIGSKCMILVGDYAGNEDSFIVEYGGEDPDYTGEMIAYIPACESSYYGPAVAAELGNTWAIIDPDTVNYVSAANYTGITPIAPGNGLVTAAVRSTPPMIPF